MPLPGRREAGGRGGGGEGGTTQVEATNLLQPEPGKSRAWPSRAEEERRDSRGWRAGRRREPANCAGPRSARARRPAGAASRSNGNVLLLFSSSSSSPSLSPSLLSRDVPQRATPCPSPLDQPRVWIAFYTFIVSAGFVLALAETRAKLSQCSRGAAECPATRGTAPPPPHRRAGRVRR